MPASTVDTLGSVEFLERMVVYLRVSANFFFASKEIHEKKKRVRIGYSINMLSHTATSYLTREYIRAEWICYSLKGRGRSLLFQ